MYIQFALCSNGRKSYMELHCWMIYLIEFVQVFADIWMNRTRTTKTYITEINNKKTDQKTRRDLKCYRFQISLDKQFRQPLIWNTIIYLWSLICCKSVLRIRFREQPSHVNNICRDSIFSIAIFSSVLLLLCLLQLLQLSFEPNFLIKICRLLNPI